MIDWIRFFDDHHVRYVNRGPNVKKNHVNIACPYCGSDDPSEHMGVSLVREAFGCWRSATHAGYKPHNLIHAVLNCSFTQAKLIAKQYSTADPETLDDALEALTGDDNGRQRPTKPKTKLSLPGNFQPIRRAGTGQRFWHYLKQRDFDDIRSLVVEYNLMYATTGIWKDRVIFPIEQDGKLVSWVGRAIMQAIDAPRYRILGEDEENGPSALIGRNELVYNADYATGGSILFVVEGPIDVLKMDFYGVDLNCNAVCPMGTRMSTSQAQIIGELSRSYKRTILLYDPGEVETVFLVMDLLGPYGIEVGEYPSWVTDDVGALTPNRIRKLVRGFL